MEGELDREHVEILYEGLLKVLAPSTRDDASTHTPLLQVLAPPARDDASTHISLVQVLAPPTSDDASTHNAPASIENPNKESQSTEV